jgi:lysylphosphatidylglycerol synthetase-like protein (DUF2156 family)
MGEKKPTMSMFLLVALCAILGNIVLQIVFGFEEEEPGLVVMALVYCVMVVMLYHRFRWVFIVFVTLVPMKSIFTLVQADFEDELIPIFILDLVSFVGVMMSARYFFWRRHARLAASSEPHGWQAQVCGSCQAVLDRPGRYCPVCGQSLVVTA